MVAGIGCRMRAESSGFRPKVDVLLLTYYVTIIGRRMKSYRPKA